MSFITASLNNGMTIVKIDGKAADAPKTTVDGDSFVQLSAASQEESGFNWLGRKVHEVIISDVFIYDNKDLNCLAWFIESRIKIDMSGSHISTDLMDDLIKVCNSYEKRKMKVIEGSSIKIPSLGGYSGMGLSSAAQMHCQNIGFNATIGV
jgi:hypothetical protein